ncbi:MAG TPA: TlpA disulfide reductase family protein [Gemmatimonas sp.]|nr:TlpA disulfide reductase family protein [Gemmatimonas sp.]
MTGKQQWAVVGLIVALLAGGAFTAMHFLEDELTSVTMGSAAPPFVALTMPDSGSAAPRVAKTMSDYRGEVVLLNIWATWCEPCRVEMPSMQALHESLGPKGLKIVAVSVDKPGDEALIASFAKEYKLSFEILHDSTNAIMATYRATGYPESFVIARDGAIRKKHIGPADWNSADNRRLFEMLLAEKRP